MPSRKSAHRQTRSPRVATALPVDIGGCAGLVKNVSASGLFIELPETSAVGEMVRCVVDLSLGGRSVKMQLMAEVVRVEQASSGNLGLGLKILEQTLL